MRVSRALTRRVTWLCIAMILLSGCHRSYYREQADGDAYALIQEKINDGRWSLPDPSIDVDPQSRMYDPFNVDCPPMPPDDPTSNVYMNQVAGMRAWDGWEDNGRLDQVENPEWRSLLPMNERNALELDIESAVQMALIHAPEFQNELEDLYFSALNVSFERFQFDVQYFGGYSGFLQTSGQNAPNGGSSNSFGFSTFSRTGGNSLQKQRLFATGAQAIVGLANSLIWEFSGPDNHSTSTLLDFAIVQPLLRGGGRDIILEQLTQSERTLLANVRQMERFRRSFYVEVATGRAANDGPNPNGPAFNGFTNTGGGAGGYLGLGPNVTGDSKYAFQIAALQSSVAQLEAFFRAGRIDFFQVEFARQALFSAQSSLLNTERSLQSNLDNFKVTLGLPPDIELELDDELIAPFQLVEPKIIPLQNRLNVLQQVAGQTMAQLFATAVEPALNKDAAKAAGKDAPAAEEDDDAGGLPKSEAGDVTFDDENNDSAESDDDSGEEADDQLQADDTRSLDMRFDADAKIEPPTLEWSQSVKDALGKLRGQLEDALDMLGEAGNTHLDIARRDTKRLKSAIPDRRRIANALRRQIRAKLERSRRNANDPEVTEDDIAALLPYDQKELEQLPAALTRTTEAVEKNS